MSDTNKEKLSLSLRTTDQKQKVGGQIRQSFSHGRSKVVTVEVKKKRNKKPGERQSDAGLSKTSLLAKKTGLTSVELENRIKAVQELAGKQTLEAQKRAESAHESLSSRMNTLEFEREKKKLQEEKIAAKKENSTPLEKVKKEAVKQANKKPADSSSDRKSSGNRFKKDANKTSEIFANYKPKKQNSRFGDQKPHRDNQPAKQGYSATKPAFSKPSVGANFAPSFDYIVEEKRTQQRASKSHNYNDRNFEDNYEKSRQTKFGPQIRRDKEEVLNRSMERQGRISIYNALDENERDTMRPAGSMKRAKQKVKQERQEETQKIVREVAIPDTLTVQELANRMAVRASDVIKSLMKMGTMVTINQVIDADTAELVVLEFGNIAKRVGDSDIVSSLINEVKDEAGDLSSRPPIVTIMGHVDHGKTSLLDALRKTDVALNEAGGITQHIGAYQITMHDSRKITFIDTPGHAAFTEMRARGANVTDVVVLVVAADDGVKEQTVEALNHAKAANVPIIIAINKMDKPGADPNRVRNDLLNHGIVVESLGGDVIDVEVSAKAGINLDKLEDSILLQADVLELKANKNRSAEAVVIEAKMERGLGPVATVLVKHGTLRVGDIFVSGMVYGKVRAIRNDLKQNLKEIVPGSPGEIIGFNSAPIPGDDFLVVNDEVKAKEIANIRARKQKEKEWVTKQKGGVLAQLSGDGETQTLAVIIKADTQGSIEAISDSLTKLATDEVSVNILHSGVGGITENDVILANASHAVILGFNVRANTQAKDQSTRNNIEIKYYSVIYDLIDDMKAIMSGMLSPTLSEHVIGSAEVRQVFDVSKIGKIAGCMVISGVIRRAAKVRVLRDDVVIHTGDVKSIHKKKEDVKEMKAGFECGVALESYSDIHLKDILEFFEIEETARTL